MYIWVGELPFYVTTKAIPIFRIFDYHKALEFYVSWLGFKIEWEHRFEENAPVYMQLSLGEIVIHLSEHHGDGTPGSRAMVQCKQLKAFHEELIAKNYKYNKPGFEDAPWNAWTVTVIDPFNNQIIFNESR